MKEALQFYVNGEWVDPVTPKTLDVINPATEQPIGRISLGSKADVDNAVTAAKTAFETFSRTTQAERVELLGNIVATYRTRMDDIAETISSEMGAPAFLATAAQAPAGLGQLATTMDVLKNYQFTEDRGTTQLVKEPVGVCGLITPWNWPMILMSCKVAPALAAGCTMVLKPSEVAPLNAIILAEIMHEAGVPGGVFNLVNGEGPEVGEAMSSHPDIDMMSFTGSIPAGRAVAIASAATIKRVSQELGGKSPNIVLDDADLEEAVSGGVHQCFRNSGQNCNAPTRMFVPAAKHTAALEIAKQAAEATEVGAPDSEGVSIGPVVSETQYDKIQALIEKGIEEGAQLVAGGPGKPEGLETGYYVKPTVFGGVTNDMAIAQEEIFGPVLVILPYESEEEAIRMANDTVYGLSGYVQSGDLNHAKRVAAQIRSGMVHINGAGVDFNAPFGGYKQSGNGREWGDHGLEEFLEVKAVMGAIPKTS